MTTTLTLPSPTWGPNGHDVYDRTYSRLKPDGSKETWEETVRRVVDGNLALVPERFIETGEAEELFELIYSMSAIPAGRHLWVTGVEGRQFNRNCHRAGWGPSLSDHFTFTFSELMKGGGVGANYSSEYLEALPPVRSSVDLILTCSPDHPDFAEFVDLLDWEQMSILDQLDRRYFRVPDTREGWVEALGILIDAFTAEHSSALVIDVTDVRPRGSLLRSFGGVASGPGPLLQSLDEIHRILSSVDGAVSPLQAMEIDHALASCVVAGNVRRSARMSILYWNDRFIFDFIDCKADPGAHWSTNISVEVDEDFFSALEASDPHAVAVFEAVTAGMLRNGEPGFYNSALASVGEEGDVRATNPCGEITLEPWESCNLGHVNLAAFRPGRHHDALRAFRLMARFLLRATFADLTDERQAEVEARNRRIGVGIFGFQEWASDRGFSYSNSWKSEELALLLEDYQDEVNVAAEKYAVELGIPAPVKTTTVAPTGTIAKLPGTTEGIHPIYARFFERRIRYAATDKKLIELEARGLDIEDCIYSAGTKVVVHHVADPMILRAHSAEVEQADEISLGDMLAVQRMVQKHYANNAVSFTANVSPDLDIEELRSALRTYLPDLKGTTLMPDASRPQSPYTRITERQYIEATDHQIGQSEMDCSTGACPIR